MSKVIFTQQAIEDSIEQLQRAEALYGHEPDDEHDGWEPTDQQWLAAVALFMTEAGFDGAADVAQEQEKLLEARAIGITPMDLVRWRTGEMTAS